MQSLPTLSRLQRSTFWHRNGYVAPACKFSKSSGPVRYIPKGARPQGRGEQAPVQPQTKKPAESGTGNEVEGINRYGSSRPLKRMAPTLEAAEDLDDQFFPSDSLCRTHNEFGKGQVENSEIKHVLSNAPQGNGKRDLFVRSVGLVSPLKLSELESSSALQSFISKAQKAASLKKAASEALGRVGDTASLSAARAADYPPNNASENGEDDFLADNDTLDDLETTLDFSVLENGLEDTSKSFREVQLTDIQSTRLREAEASSRAAQEKAKSEAVRYLAMRQYTAFQLRQKLRSRNISPELVEYAVAAVQDCGLQSDLTYAETYAYSRWNAGSWGPQRIKQALKQRGVRDDIVKAVLDRVFIENKDDLDERETNSIGMSKSAIDRLLMQASKQWNKGKTVPDHAKVRRMISWLQYRGFNFKVIQFVLKHLQKKTVDSECEL